MSKFTVGDSVSAIDHELSGVVVETLHPQGWNDWFKVRLSSPADAESWVPDNKFVSTNQKENN